MTAKFLIGYGSFTCNCGGSAVGKVVDKLEQGVARPDGEIHGVAPLLPFDGNGRSDLPRRRRPSSPQANPAWLSARWKSQNCAARIA